MPLKIAEGTIRFDSYVKDTRIVSCLSPHKDFFRKLTCYRSEMANGGIMWGMELYQGPNYVERASKFERNYSRNYKEGVIPKYYKGVYDQLKELHETADWEIVLLNQAVSEQIQKIW